MTSATNEIGDSFNGINKKLNTSFELEKEDQDIINTFVDLKKEIDSFQDKKKSLIDSNNAMVLADQEYMRNHLKTIIINTNTVINKLENEIKIGTHPRTHEVYGKLIQALTGAIKELRELNTTIVELKMKDNRLDNNIANKKISLTANQLLDMIDKAKKSSQINAIEVDFTVDEKEDIK